MGPFLFNVKSFINGSWVYLLSLLLLISNFGLSTFLQSNTTKFHLSLSTQITRRNYLRLKEWSFILLPNLCLSPATVFFLQHHFKHYQVAGESYSRMSLSEWEETDYFFFLWETWWIEETSLEQNIVYHAYSEYFDMTLLSCYSFFHCILCKLSFIASTSFCWHRFCRSWL